MCSYKTEIVTLSGSMKANSAWNKLSQANIYLDHPFDAPYSHTLNINFIDANKSYGNRVAVELNTDDARELIEKIQKLLDSEAPSSRQD